MTPAAAIFGVLAVLLTVSALLPVACFCVFIAGVPALCIFLGSLASYIAMGFLGLAHEQD
jgi:hypothetical protein